MNLEAANADPKVPGIVHLYDDSPHVDYVFCSSRGSSRNPTNNPISIFQFLFDDMSQNYTPNTPHQLVFNTRGGRQMQEMVSDIIEEHYSRGCPTNSHAYVIGGYVDITYREKDSRYSIKDTRNRKIFVKYEEVIFKETIEESYTKAIYRYAHAANRLIEQGIRPIFATIPPACLEKWNDYRLYFGNTKFLIHHSQYRDMQEGLMEAITKINGFVCKLNALHGTYTPYLAGTVVRTRAAEGKKPILHRHKLYDGVHADDQLIEEWAKKIITAINTNRTTPVSNMPPMRYTSPERLAYILEGLIL